MRSLVVAAVLTLPIAASADDLLVSAQEATSLAANPQVRFVFADTSKEFAKEHIPGSALAYAHDLYVLDDVKRCKGLPMCEATAGKLIGSELGIDAGTQVIVYDLGAGANASGTWFFLALYGHKNVKILDGGLASWKAAGGKVESGAPAKLAARPFTPAVSWGMIATRDEVVKATKDPASYLLVDARHNLDEYTGKSLLSALVSPGKEVAVARGGFIPGAVFSPWTKYAGNKGAEPGKPTFRDASDLKRQLKKLERNGYAPAKTVISYCHVGLGRGSFQYLALRRAGHDKVKLYIGSWQEWGNDASLPLGTP